MASGALDVLEKATSQVDDTQRADGGSIARSGVLMFIEAIAIRGYQSVYDVGISLGDFTVIYGESDVGKSAFFRALFGLVTSESGDSFISKGLPAAHVGLKLSSGEKIGWLKKKGKSGEYSCKVSPEATVSVWKRNRKLPPDLVKLLKFGEITVDGHKFYPNFRSQFDRLFLLFESSGRRAKVLGSLISNILLKATKQANLERLRSDADVRSLEGMIGDLQIREEFDWDNFILEIGVERKVIAKLGEATILSKTIEGLLSRKKTLESLITVDVEELPYEIFEETEKLLDEHFELEKLLVKRREFSELLKHKTDILKSMEKDKKQLSSEIKKLEEKLQFDCPHCGKPINMSEVDYA